MKSTKAQSFHDTYWESRYSELVGTLDSNEIAEEFIKRNDDN